MREPTIAKSPVKINKTIHMVKILATENTGKLLKGWQSKVGLFLFMNSGDIRLVDRHNG